MCWVVWSQRNCGTSPTIRYTPATWDWWTKSTPMTMRFNFRGSCCRRNEESTTCMFECLRMLFLSNPSFTNDRRELWDSFLVISYGFSNNWRRCGWLTSISFRVSAVRCGLRKLRVSSRDSGGEQLASKGTRRRYCETMMSRCQC